MKSKQIVLFIVFLTLIGFTPAHGQVVTKAEAGVIAHNWINIIIDQYGGWGEHEKASPEIIQQLERDGQQLGFYCMVNPEGYIVMSLRKELATVKAYSENGSIDMDMDVGMPDLIKDRMEGIINSIALEAGPIETLRSEEMKHVLEIDYSGSWQEVYSYQIGSLPLKANDPIGKDNYQEGEILLASNWHQSPPYNDECPSMSCNNSNGRAIVGCVATASSQIMKYWNWPPYGSGSPYNDTYDWVNMKDVVTTSSPQVQIDAVAELCWENGHAVNMDYGCNESSIPYPGNKIEDMFEEDFRYSSTCRKIYRDDYTSTTWFDEVKNQININRLIQFIILNENWGHSIVCDGWRETGSPIVKQYHMNYGSSGTNSDTWYALDALPGSELEDELMFLDIYPYQSIGSTISGPYAKPLFPYRYFDRDASGSNAVFMQGQNLQFMPNVTVSCSGNGIVFIGTPSDETVFYARGDISKGIKLSDGKIVLHNQGSIKLH